MRWIENGLRNIRRNLGEGARRRKARVNVQQSCVFERVPAKIYIRRL